MSTERIKNTEELARLNKITHEKRSNDNLDGGVRSTFMPKDRTKSRIPKQKPGFKKRGRK